MARELTKAEFDDAVKEAVYWGEEDRSDWVLYDGTKHIINRWLARGDGAAVYSNKDLGHSMLGHTAIVSFGSSEAQLEMGSGDLPLSLPDGLMEGITGGINWRYTLDGIYTGEAL